MRLRAALAAAVLGLGHAGVAEADPGRPVGEALRVEANACFDRAALAMHVRRWLARDTVDPRIEVEVRGDPRGEAGVALVVRRDGRVVGGRTFARFDAPCDEVRAAVGLAAALAVDATVLESLGVPAPPPASAPSPAGPDRGAGATSRIGVAASVEAMALFGVVPSAAPALAPGVDLAITQPFTLRLAGLFTAPAASQVGGVTADVGVLAGRVDGCAVFAPRVLRVRACAGLAAGRLLASGRSGSQPTFSPAAPWAAAIARADLRLPLAAWFQLGVAAEALVPLTRPTLQVVEASGRVMAYRRLAPVGAGIGVGPTFVFR